MKPIDIHVSYIGFFLKKKNYNRFQFYFVILVNLEGYLLKDNWQVTPGSSVILFILFAWLKSWCRWCIGLHLEAMEINPRTFGVQAPVCDLCHAHQSKSPARKRRFELQEQAHCWSMSSISKKLQYVLCWREIWSSRTYTCTAAWRHHIFECILHRPTRSVTMF